MATSNVPSSGPPDSDAANTLVQTPSNATRYDMTDEKMDAEFLDARHSEAGPSLMVGDVAIPPGLLKAANMPQTWAPDVEISEDPFRTPEGSIIDFSVEEIALQQRRQFQESLADNSTETTGRQHRVSWDLEAGGYKHKSQDQGLPTVVEGAKSDFEPSPFRWSARGLTPFRTNSNNEVRPSPPALSKDQQHDDPVLFRSLSNYALKEKSIEQRRRSSNAVAPDGDYFGVYEDPFASDADHAANEKMSPVASPLSETVTTRAQESRTAALARLCMGNNRNTDSVISALPRPRQETQGSVRRNSLLDVYDKAKIRGQNFQRKKWVQLVFEYTFYLLILCFIYFVLVGRPIWNGAVWYLYWVVNNKFTVAGTWSITIGLALFYAYAPLLILFEKEPPMNTDDPEAQPTQNSDTSNTALLIPCYKSANIIGPTLAAAVKIFPAKNIFVIANGNSPTPLDNTEEVCRPYGVNHVWCPIGSKIVAQYVGCYAAKSYTNVLLIDDDCALPPNFPIVSDRLKDKVKVIGYTIKSVGPDSSRGTMCQQAQDLEYKISGLQREFAGKVGSATFPHGAISLWNTRFLIDTFRTHPGFSVSEDWFFGHAARQLGSRIKMCSAVFVETETPGSILLSSGGARGGFGEMTIFKQRFYRWNFFFVNGMFYNMAYIFGSWKLGFWEIGAKIFVFQEVYETLLYLFAPFVLPISLIVRPAFCAYLMLGTLALYFVNVTIFNEIHLRRRNERVNWVVVYVYYTPYKILLTLINVFSCYYSLWKYASYFAKRHPKIVEDEKAIEVVLRLEEPKPGADNNGGRRLTVTTIGSRMSWNTANPRHSRTSRTSNASVIVAPGGDVTNPPRVLLLQRLPSHAETEHEGENRARPLSGLPGVDTEVNGVDYGAELAKTDTVDFAEKTVERIPDVYGEELAKTETVGFAAVNVPDVHGAELARAETHLAERVVQRIDDL